MCVILTFFHRVSRLSLSRETYKSSHFFETTNIFVRFFALPTRFSAGFGVFFQRFYQQSAEIIIIFVLILPDWSRSLPRPFREKKEGMQKQLLNHKCITN